MSDEPSQNAGTPSATTSLKPASLVTKHLKARRSACPEYFHSLTEIFKAYRASLVVGAIVFILLLLDQAVESLVVLSENSARDQSFGVAQIIYLYASLLVLAISLWYWARVTGYTVLDLPRRFKTLKGLRDHLPRICGVLPVIALGLAMWRAANSPMSVPAAKVWLYMGTALTAVFGAVFYLFCMYRFPIVSAVDRRLLHRSPGIKRPATARHLLVRELMRSSQITVVAILLFACTCLISFFLHPQGARWMGPLALVFSAASVWVSLATILIFVAARSNIPVTLLFILWLLALSILNVNDDHKVRSFSGKSPVPSDKTLESAFARWLEARADRNEYCDSRGYPVVLVAAEGGGIYAAYNTAMVLCRLEDVEPKFSSHVFAISGVSGGSLGASVFAALSLRYAKNQQSAKVSGTPVSFTQLGHRMLGRDFLTPLLAKGLYPDLAQQFWPAPVNAMDRATALEEGFELAWDDSVPSASGINEFSDDFRRLWKNFPSDSTPSLLLNTTEVESGRKVVISNLPSSQSTLEMFYEQYPEAQIRLSTAAALSARFPLVTPAGYMEIPKTTLRHRYVDGGYFENSGLDTLTELLSPLIDHRSESDSIKPTRFIIVRIGLSGEGREDRADAWDGLGELGSPVRALYNTRQAREEAALGRLHAMIDHTPGCKLDEFMLIHDSVPLTLGWLLSDRAKDDMRRQIEDNRALIEVKRDLEP